METNDTEIFESYSPQAKVTFCCGDCRRLLAQLPAESAQLIITSPPYNIGKHYEHRRALDAYVAEQDEVIGLCVERLQDGGSIVWQVGNYVDNGAIVPLDILLYPSFVNRGLLLRNRVIWHFEHGLHCRKRFSGRYEVALWFTKGDDYYFNLDPVRIPQKYPGKRYFRGPRAGQYSCNPLGKNPGDFWEAEQEEGVDDVWHIPNVKHNHVEKTIHPCQFPVELVERFVLSTTKPGDLVVDPYAGVGSTLVAAVLHGRRAAGADIVEDYVRIGRQRIVAALRGELRTRPMNRPIYQPAATSRLVLRNQPEQAAS